MLLLITESTNYQFSCNLRKRMLQNIARVSSYTFLKCARAGCCLAVLQEITVCPPFTQVPISFTITPSYLCKLSCDLAKHRLKRIAGTRSSTSQSTIQPTVIWLVCQYAPATAWVPYSSSITPSNLCQFSCDLTNHRLKLIARAGSPRFSNHIIIDYHMVVLLGTTVCPRPLPRSYSPCAITPNISVNSLSIRLSISLKESLERAHQPSQSAPPATT